MTNTGLIVAIPQLYERLKRDQELVQSEMGKDGEYERMATD